jgi:hypothetical protein
MFDINKIKANYLMDDGIVASLIEIFVENAKTDLIKLETAIKNKSAIETYKISHKLKSGCAYLFLNEVSSQFEEIQNMSKASDNFIPINNTFNTCKKDCLIIFEQITKEKKVIL